MIVSPMFRPTQEEIDLLNAAEGKRLDRRQPEAVLKGSSRSRFVEDLAMRATQSLLAGVAAKYDIRDANLSMRRNVAGFDLYAYANDKRIQVKGCSHVNCVDVWVKLDTQHPSYDWDTMVIVDIGVVLPTRLGKVRRHAEVVKLKPCVDFYVIDNKTFKNWVKKPNRRNRSDIDTCIYNYHYPLDAATIEHQHMEPELVRHRNDFSLLNAMFPQ
jgi:hypothetical protein